MGRTALQASLCASLCQSLITNPTPIAHTPSSCGFPMLTDCKHLTNYRSFFISGVLHYPRSGMSKWLRKEDEDRSRSGDYEKNMQGASAWGKHTLFQALPSLGEPFTDLAIPHQPWLVEHFLTFSLVPGPFPFLNTSLI